MFGHTKAKKNCTECDCVDYSEILAHAECSGWLPLNHVYYQAANIFLLLSTISSNHQFIRTMMTVAFSLLSLWGWSVSCGLDTLVWSCLLAMVNLSWCVRTWWRRRTGRLTREMETLYQQMFRRLRVSRRQFQTILGVKKEIKQLIENQMIIKEKVSKVESLSLVLKGRLLVSQAGRDLHHVTQHQFLDSPEWFGVTTDQYFQVTVTAMEDSSVLVWHRDRIKLTLMEDIHLQAVLDKVIARDVVRKLLQAQPSSKEIHEERGIQTKDDFAVEDKPPLVMNTRKLPPLLGGKRDRLCNIMEENESCG